MVKKSKYGTNISTFLGILIISVLGAILQFPGGNTIIWLILAILGAVIAISHIKIKEEISFLVGLTALVVIILAMLSLPETISIIPTFIRNFLVNLAIAFGVAGFVVSLGLVIKIGLTE